MASHWFLVWLPSRDQEARERSRSASQSRERSLSLMRDENETKETDHEESGKETPAENGLVEKPSPSNDKNGQEEATEDQKLPRFKVEQVEQNGTARMIGDKDKEEGNTIEINESEPLLEDTKKRVTIEAPIAQEEGGTPVTPVTEATEATLYSQKQIPFLPWEPKEDEVKQFLKRRKIEPVYSVTTVDQAMSQISFCVPFEEVEELSLALQRECGVGHEEGTSLSILPINMHCSKTAPREDEVQDVVEREESVMTVSHHCRVISLCFSRIKWRSSIQASSPAFWCLKL